MYCIVKNKEPEKKEVDIDDMEWDDSEAWYWEHFYKLCIGGPIVVAWIVKLTYGTKFFFLFFVISSVQTTSVTDRYCKYLQLFSAV